MFSCPSCMFLAMAIYGPESKERCLNLIYITPYRGLVLWNSVESSLQEIFVSNVVLDEVFKEEFEDSDTQISVGFQSAGDAQEECPGKSIAAIGAQGVKGPFVSARRNDALICGTIFESTGMALVCDRVVVESKTAPASGEDWVGDRGDGSGSDSNSTDAYYNKMLRADPGNPLLLTNYARFLLEWYLRRHGLRLFDLKVGRTNGSQSDGA